MGERGAIIVQEGDQQCVFYTHWKGYEIERLAAEGLRRAIADGRDHTDPDYLRRILFDALAGEHEPRHATTGFGIGHREPGDLNYPPVTIVIGTDGLTVDGWAVKGWLAAQNEAVRR
jgi:hypothetical protein